MGKGVRVGEGEQGEKGVVMPDAGTSSAFLGGVRKHYYLPPLIKLPWPISALLIAAFCCQRDDYCRRKTTGIYGEGGGEWTVADFRAG